MAQHTPGPWKRDVNYIVAEIPGGRPGGEVIATASTHNPRNYPEVNNEANARLIAEAPVMLNTLIDTEDALNFAMSELRKLSGHVIDPMRDWGRLSDARAKAQEVITRAKGEDHG
jgi:hypothetical protein